MIKKLNIFLLLNICLVGSVFSKELPTLFEVKIPADQYTNTNNGLNKAFNGLIQKLSGSRSKKFLWRIGDAKLKKVDFVASYSIERDQGQEFLSVRFNDETLIPELRKIGIPLIGFNRPVILFLLKIDTGESTPVYLDGNESKNLFATEIKKILHNAELERGVYLELPEFDLEDQNLLNQNNVLFSPSSYVQDKFYNDAFLPMDLVRVGINQWTISGHINSPSPLREKEVLNFFQERLHSFLDGFLEVPPLEPGLLGDQIIVSVLGFDSFNDFESVESELDKIFAIKERNFYFFERSRIDYKARLFQTADSLLKELRGSTKFLVKEFNPDTNKLTLEYLN